MFVVTQTKAIDLLRAGYSMTEVADELKITRGSVAGMKHRYNRDKPEAEKVGNRTKGSWSVKRNPDAPKMRKKAEPRQFKKPRQFKTTGPVVPGSKPIWELKDEECKYGVTPHGVPPDEHRFCGQPTQSGSPYCPTHHRLCRESVSKDSQEAPGRCGPTQNLATEYMVSRIASLEWKLRQERAKVRELETRLEYIAAIDGEVLK